MRQGAAPPAPSSLRQRMTRRHGGRVSNTCSRAASGRVHPFHANKTKEIQGNPSKKACISLDSFGGIGTFQWVTANPNKKIFLLRFLRNRSVLFAFPMRLRTRFALGSPGSKKTIAHIPIFEKTIWALVALAVGLSPRRHGRACPGYPRRQRFAGNASKTGPTWGAARSKVLQAQSFRPCRAHEHSMRRTTWIAGTSPP